MSTTLQAIAEALIEQLEIGYYFDSSLVTETATTVVIPSFLQNTNYNTGQFKNWWIWNPQKAATADLVKPATTLVNSSGTLSHGGSNYNVSNANTYTALLLSGWHPTKFLLPYINRGLRLAWTMWRSILTVVPNGDFENAAIGGSDGNGATGAKYSASAANVWQGKYSLQVTNSGTTNGFHQSDDFEVAPSRMFRVGVWCKIGSGTGPAALQVIDRSNSNAVLAAIPITGVGAWQYVQLPGTFNSTTYLAALRFFGQGANDVVYWDDASLLWEPVTRVSGPSWNTQWMTDSGKPAFKIYRNVNRVTRDGVGPARSYSVKDVDPGEYQYFYSPEAANPAEFEIGWDIDRTFEPLIIEARRPYLDFTTSGAGLSAWTDTTNCPKDLAVAATKLVIARDRSLKHRDKDYGGDGEWFDDYTKEQRRALPILPLPPPDGGGGYSWRKW